MTIAASVSQSVDIRAFGRSIQAVVFRVPQERIDSVISSPKFVYESTRTNIPDLDLFLTSGAGECG